MMENRGRVLFTGMGAETAARYESGLLEAGFELVLESDAASAVLQLKNEGFQAIVSCYPLATGQLGGILDMMRAKDSPNYGTGLILLAHRDRLRAAAGLVGRGVNKALSLEEGPVVLRIVLERLVEVAQPMALRLPLDIEVSAIAGRQNHEWATDNLSGSGMLIGTPEPPKIGDSFRFSLALPDGDIQGDAVVVRHTFEGREPVSGFGARFLSFQDDGQTRLLNFLREAGKQET
ncbi:MAG: PilZ domain-containing protein [Acidobacteriota bacterium]